MKGFLWDDFCSSFDDGSFFKAGADEFCPDGSDEGVFGDFITLLLSNLAALFLLDSVDCFDLLSLRPMDPRGNESLLLDSSLPAIAEHVSNYLSEKKKRKKKAVSYTQILLAQYD